VFCFAAFGLAASGNRETVVSAAIGAGKVSGAEELKELLTLDKLSL
jgi:hypothetical protein